MCYLVSSSIYGVSAGGLIMLYLPQDSGQSLVEYALILVLVALAAIVILFLFGSAIGNLYSNTIANF